MEMELEIVGAASDGRAGYKLIAEERPDLVITDVHLPGMNGLTMLKKLRSETDPGKGFLSLLENQDFSEARQAIALGVDQYLLKPVKKESGQACGCPDRRKARPGTGNGRNIYC